MRRALAILVVLLATVGGALAQAPSAAPAAAAPAVVSDGFASGKAAYEQKDYPTALRWFRAAADAGKGDGMAGLGVLYGLGLGVPANDNEATRWFKRAAETDTAWAPDIDKMFAVIDPHSSYLTERDYRELLTQTRGEFGGLGIEITLDDGRPKVISPIDDTPAARAGVKPGDIFTRIDDAPTDGMSLQDVVTRLRGKPGSAVRVTIARADQAPFDVTLTRAVIRVAAVKSHLEAGTIGYLRIRQFNEQTQPQTVAAIDGLTRQAGGKLDGLVLDLRNNPGGLLDQAVAVAGDFLDGGPVVRLVGYNGRVISRPPTYAAPTNGDRLVGVPVIVLINGASASASEIVSGALQDRRRARIMGSRSFGKGTVQTIMPLDGRGALKLSTAEYQLPSRRSIQALGVTPDRVVLPGPEDGTEVPLKREAELRGGTSEAPERLIDPVLIGTPRDHQLAVAVQELRDLAAERRAAPLPGR
ncbi:MAG: PDZ domain-containing protein [Proteobacteria bacterium]|nr:PDZ domain-containing protein [Pseudomonadota bacterium]